MLALILFISFFVLLGIAPYIFQNTIKKIVRKVEIGIMIINRMIVLSVIISAVYIVWV